jgi:tetratricopeptide (TPR) repeat protein
LWPVDVPSGLADPHGGPGEAKNGSAPTPGPSATAVAPRARPGVPALLAASAPSPVAQAPALASEPRDATSQGHVAAQVPTTRTSPAEPGRVNVWGILGVGIFLGVVLYQLTREGRPPGDSPAPSPAPAAATSPGPAPAAPEPGAPEPAVPGPAAPDPTMPDPTMPDPAPAASPVAATPAPPPDPGPTAPPAAAAPPPVASPFPSGAFGVWVVGEEAGVLASAASRLLLEDGAFRPAGSGPRPEIALRSPGSPSETVPADAQAVVEAHASALVLRSAPSRAVEVDDRVDATRPLAVAGPALAGVRLEVQPGLRARALASLAALVAGDAPRADDVLAEGSRDPGVRALTAYASLGTANLPLVHSALQGLEDDVDVGPLARFLTGAALLADGNAREAMRDLRASGEMRPFWPARLFQAFAEHRLGLDSEALASYEAVLAAAPGRPEAALGRAIVLARRDRAAALDALRALVAEHPDVAPAHAHLARLHAEGDRPEDRRLEVEALERYVALRPKDPTGWEQLGLARFRWARGGGGRGLLAAAAEAFAQETTLRPESAMAWYNRGAALHQLATERGAAAVDVGTVRSRLRDAADAYATALSRGLLGPDAARAHYNLAIVRESLGERPGARAALEAALAADADYVFASLELVALSVADRDAAGARRALARVPEAADAQDRALLEAAVAAVEGRAEDVRTYLVRTRRVPPGEDVLAPLARLLTANGWPAAARAVVPQDGADAARLVERVRASAHLYDAAAVRRDLARLRTLDAEAAASVASDPLVRALADS